MDFYQHPTIQVSDDIGSQLVNSSGGSSQDVWVLFMLLDADKSGFLTAKRDAGGLRSVEVIVGCPNTEFTAGWAD